MRKITLHVVKTKTLLTTLEDTLHITRMDALLAALGGFEEIPDFRHWRIPRAAINAEVQSYSPYEEEMLVNLVTNSSKTANGRLSFGGYDSLTKRLNRSRSSIKVKVRQLRKKGRIAPVERKLPYDSIPSKSSN